MNFESPSKGIALFESYKKRTPENKCAKTNSATDSEEAAGVLITLNPFSRAYSTSMLSIPTPPLPIIFRLGQASIRSFLTVVALRTKSATIDSELIKCSNCSCATVVVRTSNPAAVKSSIPLCEIPSFANIFIFYAFRSNSLITSTKVATLSKGNALYIDAL